ncbi:MAG: type II secretion system protein [Planctomycetes bacterium]|nr:type II secretion system protein [Planctomycetota bacterium]
MKRTQKKVHAAPAGFTLVEMLVAVGAVALVSVGLAAIFQTVGKTVTVGKRVSLLTQQAAILESQLREDIARMTRDGYLVIRHQFTIDCTPTDITRPLVVSAERFKGDTVGARPRRIDELMFFATGQYRTAREELIPGRTAQSRAARVYYGHGQKGAVTNLNSPDQTYSYYLPEFDDRFWYYFNGGGAGFDQNRPQTAQHRLGGKIPPNLGASSGGYVNPGVNYYASDWNLVRHATVLQRAVASGAGWPSDRPVPTSFATDPYANSQTKVNQVTSDSYFQIAGQPAAPSIFRGITECLPMTIDSGLDTRPRQFSMFWPSNKNGLKAGIVPRFNSGVVDIAATDLGEIAMVVNGIKEEPGKLSNGAKLFTLRPQNVIGLLEPVLPKVEGHVYNDSVAGFRRFFEKQTSVVGVGQIDERVGCMQAWMVNGFPTVSSFTTTSGALDAASLGNSTSDGQLGRQGARIRFEPTPPDVRGVLDFSNTAMGTSGRDASIRRGDVMTVGLSGIATHCSEFVVEWSWGQTYPLNANAKDEFGNDVGGKVVWYGRSLMGHDNNSAKGFPVTPNASTNAPNPDVYRYEPGATYAGIVNKKNSTGTLNLQAPTASPLYQPFKDDTAKSANMRQYQVKDWLVHGVQKRTLFGRDQSSLVSYFGYYDPSFIPDPTLGDPSAMPWPWPKMIRVTFTLADPNDPSIEQTFQYVYNIPDAPQQ